MAQTLQISNSAVSKLSKTLVGLGLVEEQIFDAAHGRGRLSVPLRISSAGGYSIGIAIYSGVLEIALVDYTGAVVWLTTEMLEPGDPEFRQPRRSPRTCPCRQASPPARFG